MAATLARIDAIVGGGGGWAASIIAPTTRSRVAWRSPKVDRVPLAPARGGLRQRGDFRCIRHGDGLRSGEAVNRVVSPAPPVDVDRIDDLSHGLIDASLNTPKGFSLRHFALAEVIFAAHRRPLTPALSGPKSFRMSRPAAIGLAGARPCWEPDRITVRPAPGPWPAAFDVSLPSRTTRHRAGTDGLHSLRQLLAAAVHRSGSPWPNRFAQTPLGLIRVLG